MISNKNMDLKKQIAELQEKRLQEILNDNSISKIEKLKLIEHEKLWGYAEYLQHEFKAWEKEAIKLEKAEAERLLAMPGDDICNTQFYQSKMIDSKMHEDDDIPKGGLQSYAEILELMLENEDAGENPLITILTTRHPYTKLKKYYNEIVDMVFDYCVTNKIIGFKNDW